MNAFLASPFASQPGALFVGLLLAWLILRLGRGAFRPRLFGVAMAIGGVMGALVLFQEAPFHVRGNPYHFSALTISFALAGFPEEGAKMVGAYFLLRPYYLRRTARDMVLATASLALGFALLENALYISAAGDNWGRLALTRSLTAVPFHVLLGLCGGYAIARAEAIGWGLSGAFRIAATWIVVSLIHGAYDLPQFLIAESPQPAYVAALSARLGLAPTTALYSLTLASLIVISALALANLGALERRPFTKFDPASVPPLSRPMRWLLSRFAGGVLAILLLVPALIALVGVSWFGFVFDQAAISVWVSIGLVCPISAASMLLLFPSQPVPTPMSAAWRRGLLTATACIAALALFATYQWGLLAARQTIAASVVVKGLELASKGDFNGAIREYGRALSFDPNFTEALSRRAAAQAALEHFDLALADLNIAVSQKPDNADYLYQRSEIHRERHETAAVFADLERALVLAPRAPILLAARAQADLDVRQLDKARADIAQAESAGPREPVVLRVKAAVMLFANDLDGALFALNQSLELKPDDVGALFTRGRVWFYKDDMPKAIEDLGKSASGQPNFLYPQLWLFIARSKLGEDGRVDLAASAAKTDDAKWPKPVAKMLLGELAVEATRSSAANDDQRCEADFYAGALAVARNETAAGRALLEIAAAECPPEFIEWEGARAELAKWGSSTASQGTTSIAGGVTTAELSDRGRIYRGAANWSFGKSADSSGELRAELVFADDGIRTEIVVAKKLSSGFSRYQIDVIFSRETPAASPLPVLGDRLAAPLFTSETEGETFPIASPFELLGEGHYVSVIVADSIGQVLSKLAGDGRIEIDLDPNKGSPSRTRLAMKLDQESAKALNAARDAWK